MKRHLYLFLIFMAFISLGLQAQKPVHEGICVSVHDGDTITVLVNGKQLKVRLEGVDAPELGQDFSQKSKQFLSGLVFGKWVTVKEDSIDKYGRTVGRVFVGYRDVSCEIISAGLAWHFKKYSSDINLAHLEESARMNRIAIWSMPSPLAPWDYRAGIASKTTPQLISTSERVIHTGPRGGKYYINSKGKKVYIKKKK